MNPLIRTLAALSVMLSLVGAGCSKEAEEESTAAAEPAATESAPAEESTETAAAPAEESTTDTINIQQMDVGQTLAETDQATKAQDWGKATDNLIKLQLSGSLKSDAESWQYNRRMTLLQDQLMEAAENGDPKAQQAIELLRRSRRVQ